MSKKSSVIDFKGPSYEEAEKWIDGGKPRSIIHPPASSWTVDVKTGQRIKDVKILELMKPHNFGTRNNGKIWWSKETVEMLANVGFGLVQRTPTLLEKHGSTICGAAQAEAHRLGLIPARWMRRIVHTSYSKDVVERILGLVEEKRKMTLAARLHEIKKSEVQKILPALTSLDYTEDPIVIELSGGASFTMNRKEFLGQMWSQLTIEEIRNSPQCRKYLAELRDKITHIYEQTATPRTEISRETETTIS